MASVNIASRLESCGASARGYPADLDCRRNITTFGGQIWKQNLGELLPLKKREGTKLMFTVLECSEIDTISP
jgi:hypothetical protein